MSLGREGKNGMWETRTGDRAQAEQKDSARIKGLGTTAWERTKPTASSKWHKGP